MLPTSNQPISIDYDPTGNKFLIDSPFYMLEHIRGIPNRKWDAKRKIWTAPCIRANVEYVRDALLNLGARFTASAQREYTKILTDLSQQKRTTTSKFPVNYPFKRKPMPHQLVGLDYTYELKACALFMDMGTGKTLVTINKAACHVLEGLVDRLVIVCPKPIRKTWEREFGLDCPVPYDLMLLDPGNAKAFDKWNTKPHEFKVLVASIDSVGVGNGFEMIKRFMGCSTRVMMAVDESSKIKTHNAQRSKKCVELGKYANYRLIMNGTPIANGPMDLFMQFEFIDSSILGIGDFYSFRNRYAVMGGYENKEIIGYQNMNELIQIITPFVFQVRKKDVLLDLPPKQYVRREIELTSEQRALYREITKRRAIGELGSGTELVAKNALELMLRQQEITGGFVSYQLPMDDEGDTPKYARRAIVGRNPKLDDLMEVVEEIGDAQLIVWAVFNEEIDLIVSTLRRKYGHDSVIECHGRVDEHKRQHDIDEVFQKGLARFCVGNAATGGMGLTMTAATYEYYFGNTFKFIDREQSEDRAHRKGQTAQVTIIDAVAVNTTDEITVDALSMKKDVSEYVRENIDNQRVRDLLQGTVS